MKIWVVAGLLTLSGCQVIRDAREAQKALAPKGEAREAVVEPPSSLFTERHALRELVDFAMTNRPSVVTAVLSVQDARLALKALAADAPVLSDSPWTAPKVSLSGGHSESSAAAHPVDELRASTRGAADATLSLDLLLWDWGRYGAAAQEGAENVLAAELNLVDARYTVFYEVTFAYFAFLENEAMLLVAKTNEYEYAEHLKQAKERHQAGEALELDILKAQLDYSQARERTVAAQKDVMTARAELLRALGLDAAHHPGARVVAERPDALTKAVSEFPTTAYDAPTAFELARTNAPSIRLARAKLRAASARVDYAVADLKPEVTASVSLNWTDPLWIWHWGVSGVQSLFTGFRKTTAVERAVVAMESAAAQVDATEQAISCDLELAIAERDNAREARLTAQSSVRQARLNLETVTKQYRLGEADRVDFTDAVASHVDALGNLVSAFYRRQRAEAAIFSLIGTVPDYLETIEDLEVK